MLCISPFEVQRGAGGNFTPEQYFMQVDMTPEEYFLHVDMTPEQYFSRVNREDNYHIRAKVIMGEKEILYDTRTIFLGGG